MAGIINKQGWVIAIAGLMIPVAHGWRNNAMMWYVEKNAFDGSGGK